MWLTDDGGFNVESRGLCDVTVAGNSDPSTQYYVNLHLWHSLSDFSVMRCLAATHRLALPLCGPYSSCLSYILG
jgi:hypothetical protein